MHIFIQWKTWQTSVMCTTTITTAMRTASIFCARKTYFKTIFLLPMRKIGILLLFAWNMFYLIASACHIVLCVYSLNVSKMCFESAYQSSMCMYFISFFFFCFFFLGEFLVDTEMYSDVESKSVDATWNGTSERRRNGIFIINPFRWYEKSFDTYTTVCWHFINNWN